MFTLNSRIIKHNQINIFKNTFKGCYITIYITIYNTIYITIYITSPFWSPEHNPHKPASHLILRLRQALLLHLLFKHF